MAYLEISKNYLEKYYNGNTKEAVANLDGILFDEKRIASAFVSKADFERYMKDNKQFCIYVEI